MKVSIIVCYNNIEMFKRMSGFIYKQDMIENIEIIGIDNTAKKYSSAAKALNYGARVANGEVLVWMHQDVLLFPCNAILTVYEYLSMCINPCLIGVAGIVSNNDKVLSAISEGENSVYKYEGSLFSATRVTTVDECFLAMKKNDWEQNKFDEVACNGWHLYGVDMSYTLSLKGGEVICLPIKLCHVSGGKLNIGFYKTLINLTKKYKKYRKRIFRIESTCVNIKNSIFVATYRFFRHKIACLIKKQA